MLDRAILDRVPFSRDHYQVKSYLIDEVDHAPEGGEEAESDGQAEGVQPSADEAVRVGGSEANGVEAQEEVSEEKEAESDGKS